MEGLDALPTAGELSRAIDKSSIGKEPRLDSIPPEAINNTNGVLLGRMASLLCQCLGEGTILRDMRDCNIVTPLIRIKGNEVIASYREISQLNIIGKVFAHVVLGRL